MSTSVDTLNQADAILAPLEIPPARRLAAELYIGDQAGCLTDQRLLTQALGLDAAPEPKVFGSAERRAVPDAFRRKTAGRRS